MENFNYDTMVEKHNGLYYIDGLRNKTSVRYYTPILPPAWAVLVKYDFNLPVISNQKLNDYLHVIQMRLQINKEMTCHVGRHSFATLLLCYGFPMEQVQRMLGHRNIKTTQIYGKILKKTIENMVEKMIDQIK
jgi:site-specific recombinase XerD